MKVLVVDDDERLTFLVRKILEAEGYRVWTAKDGRDGYLTYLIFRPDVIIADIQMPKKNGLEMMKEIRGHNPNVRTIYIGGELSRFRSLLEEEKKRYGVRLLQKPFSRDELTRLVSEGSLQAQREGSFVQLDVVGGLFSFYSELSVRNGEVNGYIKPLFKDMDVYDARQERGKSFFSKIREGVVAALAWVLENRTREEVGTQVTISGKLDSPQYSTWEAVFGLLKNAFIKAISPGFEKKAPGNNKAQNNNKDGSL